MRRNGFTMVELVFVTDLTHKESILLNFMYENRLLNKCGLIMP